MNLTKTRKLQERTEISSLPRILIADDEENERWVLSTVIREESMTPLEAQNGQQALQRILADSPDVVLLDVRMPDMDGMQVLKELRKLDLNIPVIMLTAYGTAEQAVEALKSGAYDYVTKPFNCDDIVYTIRRALKDRGFTKKLQRGRVSHPLYATMGSSDCVARLVEQVDRVAKTNLTVLITGESGVGKELVARAIHERSRRASAKFVAVNCGSLPDTLVENELYGHEDGAYTGAGKARQGRFEAAAQGTLFLDEVGDLPLSGQTALLRTLEEREACRLGSVKSVPVDVRVLAATNHDIPFLTQAGKFRADLYYRLAEFELNVPPLRDRKEDIPFLARRLLDEMIKENGIHVQGLSHQASFALQAYGWPGNVRELRNVIRRAAVLADSIIESRHLAAWLPHHGVNLTRIEVGAPIDEGTFSLKEVTKRAIRELERQILGKVLRRTNGNKAKAARILQVDYKTFHSKVKQYGIEL